MVTENSPGLTAVLTKVNSSRTILKAMASTNGAMAAFTKVNGRIIRWKDVEFSSGQTTGATRANTSTIRRKGMVSFTGLMGESMTAFGRMESNTVKVRIPTIRAQLETVNGPKESALLGRKLIKVVNKLLDSPTEVVLLDLIQMRFHC